MRLVRLWLLAQAWGMALGAAFTALLLVGDVAHLGRLTAGGGFLPIAMLWLPFSFLFGAVEFGRRVMAMGDRGLEKHENADR